MSRQNTQTSQQTQPFSTPPDQPVCDSAAFRAKPAAIPRLALTKAEAAAAIGVSVDSFERYVQPDLRLVRRGRLVLVPVAQLERWLDVNAARTLEGVA